MARGSNSIEIVARCGFGARGVVYCLVGGLATLAAIGSGGQAGGSQSALATLLDEPFGKGLLSAIALGLAGFAAWRLLEAITDADRLGTSWQGLGTRTAHMLSGAIYASLALSTLSVALGWGAGGGSEDGAARDWTAWLLAQQFGQWLVGMGGVAIIGAGLLFLAKAWRGNVTEHMTCDARTARWVVPIGRFGFAARGVVFGLIGGFLVLAAVQSNAAQAKGLGGALRALQDQSYGWVILGIVAAGLFAFGAYGILQAIYRRINAPDLNDAGAAVSERVEFLR